jgi:hypothetical protein
MTIETASTGGAPQYKIRLLIKHPSTDPADISDRLGIKPGLARKVGDQRLTPIGRALPGVYRETTWSHSEPSSGGRHFFAAIVRLIDQLEPNREYIKGLVETGGYVGLIADLGGRVNIGDEMDWQQLSRLAAMKISLGVEVFPYFG